MWKTNQCFLLPLYNFHSHPHRPDMTYLCTFNLILFWYSAITFLWSISALKQSRDCKGERNLCSTFDYQSAATLIVSFLCGICKDNEGVVATKRSMFHFKYYSLSCIKQRGSSWLHWNPAQSPPLIVSMSLLPSLSFSLLFGTTIGPYSTPSYKILKCGLLMKTFDVGTI